MHYLLDTNIVIFWLEDKRLSRQAHRIISNPKNILYVSAISIFEIEQKRATGKLKIEPNYYDQIENEPFSFLALNASHAQAVSRLPHHHRDPFDRLIIAQALSEAFTLISVDDIFNAYDIPLIEG